MRLKGIDFLRGVAVLCVAIYHFFVLLGLAKNPVFPYIHFFGQFGVSLFFVISGYLIYRSVTHYFATKPYTYGIVRYTLHRIFRIVPAYYANLFVVLLIAFYTYGEAFVRTPNFLPSLLTHLTFTSYFVYKDAGYGINGAYWTLDIEMLWYIVAPLLFLYVKKPLMLMLLAIPNLTYLYGLDHGWFDTLLHLDNRAPNYPIVLYYLSFQLPGQLIYFLGGIFVFLYAKRTLPFSLTTRYAFFATIFAFFLYLSTTTPMFQSFLFRNVMLFVIVVSIFVLFYDITPKGFKLVEKIGLISYSIYLWHMPILFVLKRYFSHLSHSASALAYIFVLAILSTLSYLLIEKKGFTLRKKLENAIMHRIKKNET